MKDAIPTIRLRNGAGDLVVRDGIVLCFFMRRSHPDVAPAVWRALETYRRDIPAGALGWYGADDGDTLPLDARGWEHIRAQMVERSWGIEWLVELMQAPGEASGYRFEYDGRLLDAPFFAQDDGATSAACFSFPTEYLAAHGPGHLRALALEIARELPFSFGYASLALLSQAGGGFSVRTQLLDLLSRFPGLDLPRFGDTSRTIGSRAQGAYWLTFLGQPLLEQLGGGEALLSSLDFPSVTFHPLDADRLLLSLGDGPEAMDVERQGVPPQYRVLARRLEPFFHEERSTWPPLDTAALTRWLRRHCL
ncbi:type VI immunity family protein [Myxococcus sp. NMCA1]|uniref:type VI immunity family protein n=1 Tax=Myxococcus sp. NMCA1 TaxID=2996785 RepID=UPI002285EBC1|nr:type VI immunity family protein [Myxococcus sp. NMCA1]WAM29239.1 DUF3396 domain-containing protein [Myxococcus sp. NMCA1]